MDNCTKIPQDINDYVSLHPPPWLIFVMLAIGFIIGLIVILIMYRCRKCIRNICAPCCCCGCCCVVCGAGVGTKSEHSSTVSLLEPLPSSVTQQTSFVNLGAQESTVSVYEDQVTTHTLYVEGEDDTCNLVNSSVIQPRRRDDALQTCFVNLGAQETTVSVYEDQVTTHTLYVEDYEGEDDNGEIIVNSSVIKSRRKDDVKCMYQKPLAFSDLLCLSNKEQALSQLYIEDKKLLSNLAYSFLNELSTTFSLFVQHLSQQLVAIEIKDKLWKEELECLAKDAFSDAKKRWLSVSLTAMGRAKMSIPDTLQVDLCPVTVQLLDHIICKTLEDRKPTNEKMVNALLVEFQNNWAVFEQFHAVANLKQIKQLEKDMSLRKQILVAIYDERTELVQQILQYQKKQLTQLDRIKHDLQAELHQMRIDIYNLWESTLDSFRIDVRRESSVLSVQLQKQLSQEERQEAQGLESNVSQKRNSLLNGQLSLPDFVTDLCDLTKAYTNGQCGRTELEFQLIGSQFSTLVEHFGAKTLNSALETERRMYKDYLQQTNRDTPHVTQSIKGNIVRLKGLIASFKMLRREQSSHLQTIIEQKVAEKLRTDSFCGADITRHQATLKGVIELQTDLYEIDCQLLVDQSLARLKLFEAQLELSFLSQERRLQELLEVRKTELSHTLKQGTNGVRPGSEAVVIANLKFQKEEKNLRTSHASAHTELKNKLAEDTKSTLMSEQFIFQTQIEKLRRENERVIILTSKKELAINALKSKLLDKLQLSGISEQEVRERIIHQHQVETELLTQNVIKTKDHQNQVLIQKLHVRKLEKKQDKEKELKQQQPPSKTYKPGSAKSFVSTVLVNLLYLVRHKRSIAALEAELELDETRLKSKMIKRLQENAKSELQVHESEVIIKLASALKMSHSELEKELQKSVIEQSNGTDHETSSLVTNSVLDSLRDYYVDKGFVTLVS